MKRGLILPQDSLSQSLLKLKAKREDAIRNLPRATPLADMAWCFDNGIKWLTDCSVEELLVVIEAMSSRIWILEGELDDKARHPFITDKETDVALNLFK